MKMKTFLMFTMTALLAGSLVGAEPKKKKKTDAEMKAEKAQAEMMEKCKVYSTPGVNHQILNSFAGKWEHTAKFWTPGQSKPEESKGTNESTWILGNRFLETRLTGTAMGQPFEGKGFFGYDNLRRQYVTIWMDTMGTGVMTGYGVYDAATKTIKESGTMPDPMTGETNKTYRGNWIIIDNDNHVYQLYVMQPDGTEMKMMEMAYRRVAP